ncbi:hypothetical protein ACFLUU_04120 [Chloroflexota bacterium]
MFLYLLIIALIFVVAGGGGLIFTFINWDAGSTHWIQGIIIFGTFAAVGLVSLGFLIMFPEEIE